jgi:very-short-patch-repair endonuclease
METEIESLIEEIACTLAASVKAYNIPAVVSSLGLADGEESEAFSSKRVYVTKRLVGVAKQRLIELAKQVWEIYPSDSLQCVIEEFDDTQPYRISSITRQHLFSCLESLVPIHGKLDIVEFMEKLWPIKTMRASGLDHRCMTAHEEICQHMVLNDDYSFSEMLEHLGFSGMSNRKLVALLEWAVHPLVRIDTEQRDFVEAFNSLLKHDGLVLVASDQVSGFPVFRVLPIESGVSGTLKNLIFASDGPKPEIVLSDAINNDIKIVRHEDHCLVYDLPLTKNGLLWTQLVQWWAERQGSAVNEEIERDLYSRLFKSLASPPEKVLFRSYFKCFRSALGEGLPALIPQVYLHYDPYTMVQLQGERRLPRQRMDFLLLLSQFERIVIEVDGKHHYSNEDRSSPSKYAEMVQADRDLRLLGYEVYRFGGAELQEEVGEPAVSEFFCRLFRKHGVRQQAAPASDDRG